MNHLFPVNRRLTWTAILGCTVLNAGAAIGQTLLFRDDFSIDAADVDRTRWTGPAVGSQPLGRTYLRAVNQPIQVLNGMAVLRLDTFNAAHVGTFLGSEIATQTYYPVGTGIAFEARVMPEVGIPPGMVASVFTYVIRDIGGGTLQQDEIDWELLTALVQDALSPQLWTNVYKDEFLGSGSPVAVTAPGQSVLGAWNTLRIEWYANRVRWLLNGRVVMDRSDKVPNDAMNFRMNLWGPASDWPQAYSAALQPATSLSQNRTYRYYIDWAAVTRLPGFVDTDRDGDGKFTVDDLYRVNAVPADLNGDTLINADDARCVELPLREGECLGMARQAPPPLLVSSSFEAAAPAGPITGWTTFGSTIGNVLRDGQCPRSGSVSAKVYGQFNSQPNVSGVQQNLRVTAGQTLSVTVYARTPCNDRLAGGNTASMDVQFRDGSGALLSTTSAMALNAASPCDVHVPCVVTATAPARAVSARIVLRMNQTGNATGAVHFDDVTPIISGP